MFQKLRVMHEVLTDREVTSVRIVVNPEKMVIREAERSFMYLNLYGFNTDALIVNRLLIINHFVPLNKVQVSYKSVI